MYRHRALAQADPGRGDLDADECARIGIIRFVVPDAPGDLVVDLTLDGGDIAATNRYRSTITR